MSRWLAKQNTAWLFAAALLACSLNAAAQEKGNVEERLARIERTLNSSALVNMANQMDAVQRELQILRGEAELLRRDLDEIKQRQRDLYLDIDRRLVRLENAQTNQTGNAAADNTATETGDDGQAAPDGAAPATGEATAPADGQADNGQTAQPATNDNSPPPANTQSEQEAYAQAFDFLKAGRYQQAAEAFGQFLTIHPDGELADNAKYWLGESFYVVRDFEQAMPQFRRVLDEHPNSPKKSDALLKIGFIQFEQGDMAASKATLQQVIAQYPGSGVAALAEQRLARIKAQNR